MTVPASDRLSQLYTGNGVNTRFDFTFRVFDQEDATGIAVKVDLGTEFETMDESLYQVTINQDNLGGYVVFNTAPSNQTSFYIAGETPVDQALDITNYDNFYPDSIEKSLDKLTAILQEWSHLLGFEEQARKLSNIKYDESAQLRENQIKAELQSSIDFIEQNTSAKLQEAIANGTVSALAITTVENESDLANLLTWDGRTVSVTSIGNYKYKSSTQTWERDFITDRQVVNIDTILELDNLAVWPGRTVFIKSRNGEDNSFFAGTFVYSKNATDTVDNGIVLNAVGGRWIRKIENSVIKAQWFGTPNQIDDQKILNPAFSAAISKGLPVDITGNNWGINGTVKAVGHINVIADFANYVEADPSGNYPNKFAFEFGDPLLGAGEGRTVLQITGYLHTSCKNRATRLNGIFIKGSFLNIESIRANNFSGTGVKLESVWDSVFSRISVELCGNEVDYAFVCDSKDDTSNCLNIVSLQVEQSVQRGIFIFNTIRSVINNIHSERLYRTNKNTANTPVGYDLNHIIYMGNSMINQAIFHSNDGDFYMRLDGANLDYNCILAPDGNLYGEFGDHINYSNLNAKSFLQTGVLTQITFDNPQIESILVYQNVVITNPTIKNLIFGYACKNVTTKGGGIENVGADTSSTIINGQISFNNTTIKNVYEVGYNTVNPTSFYACNIENFYGRYGGTSYVNGGYISNADLASDFAGIFDAAKFSSFKSNGSRKYLTRACSASGSVIWGLPNLDMPAGSLTERIGYSSDGKIYQNTATGVNWQKLI